MSKIKNILKGALLAVFAVVAIATPSFAACDNVTQHYPGLSNAQDPTNFPYKCGSPFEVNGEMVTLYGKTQNDCASAGLVSSDPSLCEGTNTRSLPEIVRTIINTVIFIIGMLAVIMIILGGISYATSQGDASKVKKGKDTILYGIVGLIVALLAYPIVSFVLNAIQQ